MAADTSWLDAIPPVAPQQPAVDATVVVRPPTAPAAPADASWLQNIPAITPPPPAPPQPSPLHPVAAPTGNLATDVPRIAGTMGTDLLGGFLGLPGLAAQGVDWLGRRAGYDIGVEKGLTSIQAPGTNQPLFPSPDVAKEMAYNTTGATEYQPQSLPGRMLLAGAETAAGGGIRGTLKATAEALPALFGGGGLGQATAETFPEHPFLARLAGLLLGGKATQLATQAPTQAVSTLLGEPSPTYQSYTRLGVPTDLAGDVTGNRGLQFAQNTAAKFPSGEERVVAARDNAVSGWQDALNRTADNMGPQATAQEAGVPVQAAANKWLSDWKADINQKWNNFRVLAPKSTQIPVTNFQNSLNSVLGDFGGADNLAKALQPQLAQTLQDALGADLKGGTTLPWQTVQAVRSRLGEMLEGAPVGDMAQSAVKRLYGALSDDMNTGAAAIGPQAHLMFRVANAATAAGHDLIEDHIGSILNATTPEQATQAAMQGARLGGSRLQALTQAMPEIQKPLGAYALRQAAPNESSSAFATNIGGAGSRRPMYSPEAFKALFPDQATQQAIQDLTNVGQSMKDTERLVNSSTAPTEARIFGRFESARSLGEAGHAIAGTPGRMAGFALGAMMPNIVGRAAANVAVNPMVSRYFATPPMLRFSGPPSLVGPRLPFLSLVPGQQAPR